MVVISAAIVALGVTLDLWTLPPQPRAVRVTLADGRQVILEGDRLRTGRLGMIIDLGEPLTTREAREALGMAISEHEGRRAPDKIPPPPDAWDIRDVIVFNPESRSSWLLHHANFSMSAIAAIVVLWLAFASIRWIARGFA